MRTFFCRNGLVIIASFLSCGTLGNALQNPQQTTSEQKSAQPGNNPSLVSDEPRINPPSPNYSFPANETLQYGAEWHMFNAGTATIQLQPDGASEKLSVTANTAGMVSMIFPVRDLIETQFDPKTFCSTRIYKHSEEGQRKREVTLQIDYARGKNILDEKNLKTSETKHEENDSPACATDIVTGFFYVSSLPLQIGSTSSFPVSDGGKTTVVSVHVEGREEVKVPAGTFPAIRVSVEALSGKLQGRGKLWVWFADNPAHTPLQMRGKMGWGTVMFKLEKIEK